MRAFFAAYGSMLGVVLGLVVIAALINRYSPRERARLGRTVVLFGLFLGCALFSLALSGVGAGAWATRFAIAGNVFQAFTTIDLVALCLFVLALPAMRVNVVAITSDIIVGIAYVIAALAVFRAAGMDPSSVLATSAIVSGVLALSLQATLGNILGGVALQLDGSIHLGDWVQLENGKQGKVTAIRWRHTVVETRDWDTIVVPNATLLANQIQILGKRTGESVVQHRMTLNFNVDWRYPPAQVIDIVNEALSASPMQDVATRPPPHCLLYDMAKDGRDSFGYYLVRYWLLDLMYDDRAQSLVRTRVISALRRANIPLARPAQTVFFAPAYNDAETRAVQDRRRRVDTLAALDLFHTLTEDQREQLGGEVTQTTFLKGETILRAGSTGDWLYVLAGGTAEVRSAGHVVATIDAPNFFGEMGLMTGEPRAADVIAKTNVDGFRIEKAAFERILQAQPEIAAAISATLAKRGTELAAAREGLDARAREQRQATEQRQILQRIQAFFGLK